ncbi:Patatin-like phospholipase [compost metagenome]
MHDSIQPKAGTRAVVLGGGGVTGMAWEIGVMLGLSEAGVDLGKADAIFGTSAGSFAGAALASGSNLLELFAAQSEPAEAEIPASAGAEVREGWRNAFITGGSDPEKVGLAFGELAKRFPAPVPPELRRRAVQARLKAEEWPEKLRVTAIEADTGALHVLGKESGLSLIDAVSASGAVPGIWPIVHAGGRAWIDGGMVSPANARLAQGYERIVILAPMPGGYGLIPGAAEEAAAMERASKVSLIVPDANSAKAIGPNPYDPSRRGPAAIAGREQGSGLAEAVRRMW